MSQKISDMTVGNPTQKILSFAFTILGGSLFQQLYTVMDSLIVGQLLGVNSYAAVGAAGFFSWMMISIILGLTQGFGILFSQVFGAGEKDKLYRVIKTSIWLSAIIGILMTVIGLVSIRQVLELVRTPHEIFNDTASYLFWMIAGLMGTMAYNLAATILRSLGNGKAPMIAVLISSLVNIVLGILFITVFKMGVTGTAFATVIATFFAAAYCIVQLIKIKEIEYIKILKSRFDIHIAKGLLNLGFPLAFRNAVISLGGLFIQYSINGYGKLFVAGTTAAKKYFGILELVGCGLDGAIATYVAQNFGAGKMDRVKTGMKLVIRISFVSTIVIIVLILTTGRLLIKLMLGSGGAELDEIIEYGYRYLCILATGMPVLYLLYIYRSALQGMGNTMIPMLSGFLELIFRIAAISVVTGDIGKWGVYFSDFIGWVAAASLLIVSYYIQLNKMKVRS